MVVRYTMNRLEFGNGIRAVMLRVRSLWACVGFGVFLYLAGVVIGSVGLRNLGIIWAPLALLLSSISLVLVPSMRWRRNLQAQGKRVMTATEQGVLLEFVAGELRADWSYFDRVVETPTLFVLVHARRTGCTVPKRAMSPEVQERFRHLTARHTHLVARARAVAT